MNSSVPGFLKIYVGGKNVSVCHYNAIQMSFSSVIHTRYFSRRKNHTTASSHAFIWHRSSVSLAERDTSSENRGDYLFVRTIDDFAVGRYNKDSREGRRKEGSFDVAK